MAAAASTDPTFPNDYAASVNRNYFERFTVHQLAEFLQGQYLYCHTNGILVQIVEAEAFSETQDPGIYHSMFGSPCAQFRIRGGQLIARFPTQAQHAVTPQTAAASEEALELYITVGDEQCGDVMRLVCFMPVEGLKVLERRLGHDNVEGMLIGKEGIAKALGAGENVLDWDANPFLFQSGGVQLYFPRLPLPTKTVVPGPRHLDEARVGVDPPGRDELNCFSLEIDSDMYQRIQ